jgi:hypothetical protein
MTFFVYCLVVGIVAGILGILVSGIYSIYQGNLKRLNINMDSQIVKPNKVRFVFSWLIYSSLLGCAPVVLLIWLIWKEFPFNLAGMLLLVFLSFAPGAYPYYFIVASNDKINGAIPSGLLWERVDIKREDIDKARLSRQLPGKILGIVVIHSKGRKILTLGLSNQQLEEITI